MKLLILLVTTFFFTISAADTITKWTDKSGNVHYGDTKAVQFTEEPETVEIRDTFDQRSYDEGRKRYKETKNIGNKMETERLAKEKKLKAEKNKPIKLTVVPFGERVYRENLRYRTNYPRNLPYRSPNISPGGYMSPGALLP